MLQFLSLVLVTIVCGLYWFCTRTFDYWKNRNVVGPKPIPLFGNIKDSALRRKHTGDLYKEIYDQFPNEKVIGVYRMTKPTLIIRDLDVVKDILIKHFDNFPDRGIKFRKEASLGNNLFHTQEEAWRVLRAKLTPMFTSGKIKGMFKFLDEHSDKMIKNLDKSSKIEHDAKLVLKKYTIGTISSCAFGIDIDTDDEKQMETLNMLDDMMFFNPLWFEVELLIPGFFRTLKFSPFPKVLTDFFFNLVDTVFSQRGGKPSERQDFMDMMLKMKIDGVQETKQNADHETISLQITETIIAAQAFIFYAAGYETSTSTMSNMLYHLAQNQQVQDKLINEIDVITRRHGGNVTYDSVADMTYLSQVFDETLRMHPVIDAAMRSAKEDYLIPGTKVVIEKGQTVFIPVAGIHYDEKYYPDPHTFDPERFSQENSKDRHPCANLAFGVGQRNCIGSRFGKIQSAVCIAKLLSHYKVTTSPNTPESLKVDPWRVVYAQKDGVFLNFVQRR